jgi:hypothetical protein
MHHCPALPFPFDYTTFHQHHNPDCTTPLLALAVYTTLIARCRPALLQYHLRKTKDIVEVDELEFGSP